MCKYYGKTDFGGCYHSVKSEDIDQSMHFKKEYCSHYIHGWVKAIINDDTAVLGPVDTIDPACLAADLATPTAGSVRAMLAPCPYKTYDSSAAVLASQDMSAEPAARSIGPVCPACHKKCADLDSEWDMFKLLIATLNANIGHQLYSGNHCLSDGREVPRYLKIMIPMTAERLQRMDDQRNAAFAPDAATNVFVSQQWDSLRFFQRLVFYEYVRRKPMPSWSTNVTMFDDRRVDAGAWEYLNSQLHALFHAQDMDHVLPGSSGPGAAVIDLKYSVPALAPPRGDAEIAGWADLHPRIRAEDAAMATDTNVFELFRPSACSVLEDLSPSAESGRAGEAFDEVAACICGDDVFLGAE